MKAPVGTVTILFSDIEGSTRLWESYPDQMRVALAQHDQIMRDAIESNSGLVFKTIGDAFCAAFETALEGLAAATAAQLALNAAFSEEPMLIRVRMALHTGAVEYRDSDYFGQPLNRVARLLSAGHGGQTLLSLTTHELVRDFLPPKIILSYLGDHRLKDLARPEPVYQVVHEDLRSAFPPLRSLDNPELPNNLPQQMTSFVGREHEIKEVTSLLGRSRLVTLTGSGGCGKTRLALQVAAELLDQFPEGVWLVELGSISDPNLVINAVAQLFSLRKEPDRSLQRVLIDYLKTKKVLLVFDNCEHLLDACASLAENLLKGCPTVQILATSREAMGIAGEFTQRVPSLSLPKTTRAQTAESLTQYEAVRLFVDRAVFHAPTFEVTNENAPDVAQLCVRLDGIPLAIELAAARVKSLSVAEVNHRLDDRFKLLTSGSRTALPRQQTLRALIDWSYDLLSEMEKTLLKRLSVFASGWTMEAVEEVCAGESLPSADVLDLLSSLVDKSLVLTEVQNSDSFKVEQQGKPRLKVETRYRLLLTVRQYAQDRLAEDTDVTTTQARFVQYFTKLVESGESKVRGKDASTWISRFEREHDNFRAALAWSLEAASTDETAIKSALSLAGGLGYFWFLRGFLEEGTEWLNKVLALPTPDGLESARIKALGSAAWMAHTQGEAERSQKLAQEMIDASIRENDLQNLSMAYNIMGLVLTVSGNQAPTAREYLEKALEMSKGLPNSGRSRASVVNLGFVAAEMGDFDAAREYINEGLSLSRQAKDIESEAVTLWALGIIQYSTSDFTGAEESYTQADLLVRNHGFTTRLLDILMSRAELCIDRGDPETGLGYYREAYEICQEFKLARHIRATSLGIQFINAWTDRLADPGLPIAKLLTSCLSASDWWNLAVALDTVAIHARSRKLYVECSCLLGVSNKLRMDNSSFVHPFILARQAKIASSTIAVIGEPGHQKAFELGARTPVRQAMTLALEIMSS